MITILIVVLIISVVIKITCDIFKYKSLFLDTTEKTKYKKFKKYALIPVISDIVFVKIVVLLKEYYWNYHDKLLDDTSWSFKVGIAVGIIATVYEIVSWIICKEKLHEINEGDHFLFGCLSGWMKAYLALLCLGTINSVLSF